MHRFLSILLSAPLASCCLSAQAPSGFLPVGQNNFVDGSGNAVSNATVCAQVTLAGKPSSVQVGGSKVTSFSSVCAPVSSGKWTLNLPDFALSTPKFACIRLTATDNTSGDNLLTGYNCIQPRSTVPTNVDASNFWCDSSGCNLDHLPPNYPASDAFVAPTGPRGLPGVDGAPGCLNTQASPCTNLVAQQPTGDQYSSNVLFMAPTGDVAARAQVLYDAAFAAGKGLTIVLTGMAPLTQTQLNLPITNALGYRMVCINSGGWSFNGTGAVVNDGHVDGTADTGVNSDNAVVGCNFLVDQHKASAGISTRNKGITSGFHIDRVSIRPLNDIQTDASITAPGIEISGNVESGLVTNSAVHFFRDGFRFVGATPGAVPATYGANAWVLSHNNTDGSGHSGIYVQLAGQSLSIRDHIDEFGGCSRGSDNAYSSQMPTTGSSLQVDSVAGLSVTGAATYLEGSCGKFAVRLGTGTTAATNVTVGEGATITDQPNGGSILAINAPGLTVSKFAQSGNAGAVGVQLAATEQSGDGRIYQPGVVLDPAAKQPLVISNASETTQCGPGANCQTARQIVFQTNTCVPIVQRAFTYGWSAKLNGFLNTGGYGYTGSYNEGYVVSAAAPAITFDNGTKLTFSLNSSGYLCGTATGTAVSFSGSIAVSDGLNSMHPTAAGACTPAGTVTLVIDGTARKVAYCN